ncbi:hypothetical protein CS542_08570 [Pedobacter sp. IW39]|nr:hypothetical protein CS542_08570 [Pedobacter sp. IW39]
MRMKACCCLFCKLSLPIEVEGKRTAVELNVTMGIHYCDFHFGLADIWLSVQSQLAGGKKIPLTIERGSILSHPDWYFARNKKYITA